MKKLVTEKILYIIASLIVLGITALLNMKSDIEAVELKQSYSDSEQKEMRIDILAIRCAVTNDKTSCLKFRAMSND